MAENVFDLEIPLTLRNWQKDASKRFKRFTVIVAHRRAGKTILNLCKQLEYLFSLDLPGVLKRAAYIGPTYRQVKDMVWAEYKKLLKGLPEDIVQFNESELKIKFCDGTTISLYGSENYDNLRGIYLNHCILDEYAQIPSRAFSEVISPMLDDYEGHCIITGTPKGKNDFYYKYQTGLDPEVKDWASLEYDVYKANEKSEAWIANKRDVENKYSPESWKQEYELAWDVVGKGSIFGKDISKLKEQKRVVDKEYDPAYPVVAGLDLGYDGTAVFYIQKIGKQLIIIDMDFYKDEDHTYTANKLLGKPDVYDHIIIGHDGDKKTAMNKKKTRAGIFEGFGFKVKIADRLPLMDAIASGRALLGRCQITKKCVEKRFKFEGGQSQILDALSLYKLKVDDEGHTSETEKHDNASHIGSALRNLAVGLKENFGDSFNVRTRSKYHYNQRQGVSRVNNKWDPLNRRKI